MSLSSVFGYLVVIAAAVCLDVAVLRWQRRNLPRQQPQRTRAIVKTWLDQSYRKIVALTAARLPNWEQRPALAQIAANEASRPAPAPPIPLAGKPVAAPAPLEAISGRPLAS